MRESQILSAIINYLQYAQNRKELYFVRENTGAVMGQSGRYIRFGKRGISDLIVYFKGGRTEFWEVKNEKGRLENSQKEFKEFIEELGFIYRIIRSVDDIIKQ